jgi:acetolactate synthase-1/2/3 large subunit
MRDRSIQYTLLRDDTYLGLKVEIMETITSKRTPRKNPKTMRVSGAEAIIHCLLAEGVDLIYGYPGGAIMPVYDELYKFQDKLTHILTRHEQGATHAAQGYARVSGRVGVAMATSGPGATNLVTGLADAQIDSTPMVCITGQVSRHLLGSDAFQETDIIGISTPVTKWNYQITRAEEIPEIMAKAFFIARSGRPGPVLIDITKNAQFDELDFHYEACKGVRSYQPVPRVEEKDLDIAAELINSAKKPYIVFGQGVILGKAEEELRLLVEKAGIPAAWTILGLSAMSTDHPLNVGMVGMHGNYGPNVLTNECDLLIAIGMRFDDRVTGSLDTYAKQAKIIHMEIDPAEVNKNVKVDLALLGDARDTLSRLLPKVRKNSHEAWRKEFAIKYEEEFKEVIEKDLHPTKDGLTMGEVVEEINQATKSKAVIVTDVGQHQMVACRYAKFDQTKSNVTSGGLGTMGFALPAAIGAKMGAPEREVVAIIGDGGYQMTIQELATIYQNKLAVKIVVLNNDHLGMVRQWQELFFERRYASTVMTNPDFVKIAEGYHIQARRVTERKDLKQAVQEMIASSEPYFLEVKVEKEDNVFPMIPSGASVSDIRLK